MVPSPFSLWKRVSCFLFPVMLCPSPQFGNRRNFSSTSFGEIESESQGKEEPVTPRSIQPKPVNHARFFKATCEIHTKDVEDHHEYHHTLDELIGFTNELQWTAGRTTQFVLGWVPAWHLPSKNERRLPQMIRVHVPQSARCDVFS